MIVQVIAKAREFADLITGSEARRIARLKENRDRAVQAIARRYFCTSETPEAMPHERAAIEAWEAEAAKGRGDE